MLSLNLTRAQRPNETPRCLKTEHLFNADGQNRGTNLGRFAYQVDGTGVSARPYGAEAMLEPRANHMKQLLFIYRRGARARSALFMFSASVLQL
jgi:hypothetical protein